MTATMGQANSRITIADVARYVGVAPSTVSHALSGKRPISLAVRQRIDDAIEKLGYQPHFAARSLAMRKTEMIGLIVSELYNPNTCRLIEALEGELVARQYMILLGLTQSDPRRRDAYLRQFAQGTVDGVINLDPELDSLELQRLLPHTPAITYMRPESDAPFRVDYADGVMKVMEHLWSLGHRRIGYLALPECQFRFLDDGRLASYEQFYRAQGCRLESRWISYGDGRVDSGLQQGQALAEAGCTAIVAGNDLMAAGAMQAVRQAGLQVPQDVSIVGFDDSLLATITCPALTTVRLPVADLARWTIEALVCRMSGQTPARQRAVHPQLVVRGSTAKPPRRRSPTQGRD